MTLFVNVPSGLPMTTAICPGFSVARIADVAVGKRCAGRVDLDDRQVGQRVHAVDRAGQPRAVRELDRDLTGVETTWRLVSTQPAAS